jgi:hypothetical protein
VRTGCRHSAYSDGLFVLRGAKPRAQLGQPWGQYLMLKYRGFLIEPFETEPGRWRAEITRPDHRKIKTFPDNQEHDFIRTGGAETFSAEAAIKVAMRLIDGGGMS